MNADFNKMSIAELQVVIVEAEKAITSKKKEEKTNVLNEMKALAKERGFDFSELVGGKAVKAKAPAKYRNPNNHNQTWSGKGRQPNWVKDTLNAGKRLADIMI